MNNDNLKPFKPGQSGNPAGRPKGSRNKLAESFLADAYEEWQKSGKAALQNVAQDNPYGFCKIMADLLPKELNVKIDPLEEMNDEQLLERARNIYGFLSSLGIQPGPGEDKNKPGSEQAKILPPLH